MRSVSSVIFFWLLLSTAGHAQAPAASPSPGQQEAPAPTPAAETPAGPSAATPAAPAQAAPGQAASGQAAACFPECRAGFVCHQARCISACNPPCPEGTQCTAGRSCEPAPSAPSTQLAPPPPPTPNPPPATATQPAPAATPPEPSTHRERVRAFRREHRTDRLLTVDGSTRLHLVGDPDYFPRPVVLVGAISAGMAKNLVTYFGVLARGTLSLGSAALNEEAGIGTRREVTRALYYGLEAELVPYVGPFGNFYFGPLLTAGFHGYSRDQLRSQYDDTAPLGNRFLFGLGATAGIVAGERRNVHIYWFVRSSLTDWMPMQAGFGMGYRFGVGHGPIP